MSLENILKKMGEDSFSLRDKGTRFEELIKNWFLSAPLYCDDIKEYGYGMNFHTESSLVEVIVE